jgi:HSP20 family protein
MARQNPQQQQYPLANWRARFFPSLFEDLENELMTPMAAYQPGITLSEDKQNFYVEAQVPGLQANDIDITYDKGTLIIHGERKEEKEDKERRYYSRSSTSVSYRVSLPNQVDETKEPKATIKDGILTMTLTKAQQNQMKKIPVKPS